MCLFQARICDLHVGQAVQVMGALFPSPPSAARNPCYSLHIPQPGMSGTLLMWEVLPCCRDARTHAPGSGFPRPAAAGFRRRRSRGGVGGRGGALGDYACTGLDFNQIWKMLRMLVLFYFVACRFIFSPPSLC